MDEMRMIRSLLDEAPPSAGVVAEGRRRLTAGASPARTRRRLWGGLTALAGAVAAVALVVGPTGGPPAHRQIGPGGRPTARQVLLTAAEKAATTPAGRYWHTHVISSEGYHVDRGDYMIFGSRHEIDQWIGRSDKDGDVFRSRFAGAAPQTPADRAAWKRAGSPKRWRVRSNDQYLAQSATPDAWDLRRSTPADKRAEERFDERMAEECAKKPPGACPPALPTAAQQDALSRDPQALKRYLLKAAGLGGVSDLLRISGDFLVAPSSPELRSAVFRVLADTPGVRTLGTARDPLGRPAIVLAGRMTQNESVYDEELLLAPETYVPLGTQTVLVKGNGRTRVPARPGTPGLWSGGLETRGMRPGAITHSEIYVAMGWTDTPYGG